MKPLSCCGHTVEGELTSALVRDHCETAPPSPDVYDELILLLLLLLFPAPQVPALLQSKAVCRMRIPVPAPALPRRRLPPAKPDRGTRFARRNGRAKPA